VIDARRMRVACEGVQDQHRVVLLFIQPAVGLIGDLEVAERLAAIQVQRIELRELRFRDHAPLDTSL